MALAFYRKYRPKTLAELVGQEANAEILWQAARQDKIGHAYLFHGPRGTGKTSTARLIAKLVNCERRRADAAFRAQGEPCNTCAHCNEIENGTAFDLIEIDAASNRGIEEIRNLKEGIGTAPARGRFKVYIIDEAHMLTREASNALLKTLEEPPRHAVLILATTEYEKLPPTITSRTQRFLFKKLPKVIIVKKLQKIAHNERINIEPAALELIAAVGEGSLRDAESLLDQISSLENAIDIQAVERITGRVGFAKVRACAELVIKGDIKASLAAVNEIYDEGHNIVQLTKDLIHYLRKALAVSANPDVEKFFHADLTSDELAHLKRIAAYATGDELIPLLRSLIRAYGEMRYSPFAMIPLELALLEQMEKIDRE